MEVLKNKTASFPFKRSSRGGFGLVEVLVAAGLLSVIGLALSQIVNMGAKGQGAVQAQADMANLKALIDMVMTSSVACAANLGHITVGPLPFKAPITGGLKYPDGTTTLIGPPNTNPALAGTFGNGLTITALQLAVFQNMPGTTNYMANIHVEAAKGLGGPVAVLGSSTFSFNSPVQIRTNAAGLIIGCGAGNITSGITPLAVNPPGSGANNCGQPPAGYVIAPGTTSLGAGRNCIVYAMGAPAMGNDFGSNGCYFDQTSGNILVCTNNGGVICGWTCFN